MTMMQSYPIGEPTGLSKQALSIWAKTAGYRRENADDDSYLLLWQHMEDTGAVSSWVWNEFLPGDVKSLLAEDIGGEVAAECLYRFIAMIHDVGKASPAFAAQDSDGADRIRRTGLRLSRDIAHDPKRSGYRHELVGFTTILDWFKTQGFPADRKSFAYGLASVVMGHHGSSANDKTQTLLESAFADMFLGDRHWSDIRMELLDWGAEATGFSQCVDTLQSRPLRRRTQILLTALVIIADWIASDKYLFPLNDDSGIAIARFDAAARARKAWRRLDLPRPWKVNDAGQPPDELFAQQFAIPGAQLRPVQRAAVDAAQRMEKPGLLIVEANMGEGKTEAALLAAEILAGKFHCGGIYYALPSQATANAMFTRILDWIGHLPADERNPLASLFLAHGKRELNEEYEQLRERWFANDQLPDLHFEGEICDADQDDPHNKHMTEAVVASWLTGRKRGNLSDFVVGTVDQVLMAGLRSRHVVLRHLALAGKVVILDEIHSNTAYMNVYMETVLSWLGTYHVPVIMLSATLPQERRRAFLAAYQRGFAAPAQVESFKQRVAPASTGISIIAAHARSYGARRHGFAAQQPRSDGSSQNDSVSQQSADTSVNQTLDMRYPLISVASGDSSAQTLAPDASGRSTNIAVRMLDDDDAALLALLRTKLSGGGCAVVIRDTVGRAQHTYELLAKELDVDVMLDHSRFLAFDRARLDRELIARYGKYSTKETRSGVVVATQVVEQSLDVDFDLMITDVAPIDLILQRAGRLHRHSRGMGESERPHNLREAQLYLTGVTKWREDGPETASGLDKVYSRSQLLRALAVLAISPDHEVDVNVPDDIPRLVQHAYDPGFVGPEPWRESMHDADEKLREKIANSQNKAGQWRIFEPERSNNPFQLGTWLSDNLQDPDSAQTSTTREGRASVREGEDSFETIVLCRDDDDNIVLPPWGDFGDINSLPTSVVAPDDEQARAILSCSISLGSSAIKYLNMDAVIVAIENRDLDANGRWLDMQDGNKLLQGQLLVLLDGNNEASYRVAATLQGRTTMKTLHFHYSPEKGLETDCE
jgi:CRISPR-associated endonuclease/helicase Cas3